MEVHHMHEWKYHNENPHCVQLINTNFPSLARNYSKPQAGMSDCSIQVPCSAKPKLGKVRRKSVSPFDLSGSFQDSQRRVFLLTRFWILGGQTKQMASSHSIISPELIKLMNVYKSISCTLKFSANARSWGCYDLILPRVFNLPETSRHFSLLHFFALIQLPP
jgi:hypothetical protein